MSSKIDSESLDARSVQRTFNCAARCGGSCAQQADDASRRSRSNDRQLHPPIRPQSAVGRRGGTAHPPTTSRRAGPQESLSQRLLRVQQCVRHFEWHDTEDSRTKRHPNRLLRRIAGKQLVVGEPQPLRSAAGTRGAAGTHPAHLTLSADAVLVSPFEFGVSKCISTSLRGAGICESVPLRAPRTPADACSAHRPQARPVRLGSDAAVGQKAARGFVGRSRGEQPLVARRQPSRSRAGTIVVCSCGRPGRLIRSAGKAAPRPIRQ